MMSPVSVTMLLYFSSAALPVVVADSSALFGTVNGYDVGGTDPLCYVSNLTMVPNVEGYTNVEVLNDGLYSGDQVTLLPKCYEGTTLTVLPLDLGENQPIFTGTPYTFRLTLEANVSAINPDIAFQAFKGNSTIHVRLQACNAVKKGFCNPLVDSRQLDKNLKPKDTDINASSDKFPEDETKWKYVQGTTLLGIEDGPLVFSRWCRWTLRQVTPDSPTFKTAINITFQLPRGTPAGAYFFIGHAVMNFDLNNTIQRVDVAEVIPNNAAEVRDPPTINTVSDSMKITLGVTIGIFGSMALFMFAFVVAHRNHAAMKLAQGPFLAAMTLACSMQIICSFLFLPVRDIFCRLAGPLVLVPMTFVAASLVGRIWRVYRVLSTVQKFGRLTSKKTGCDWGDHFISALSFLAKLPFCFTRNGASSPGRRKGLRQTASASETTSLICILTLPQLIMQVVVAALSDSTLETELDPTGNIGRVVCGQDEGWVLGAGIGYAAFVYMLAVTAAWVSRSLPSAFNEKDQVFHAATISTVLAFISISLLEIMNDPTTEPDVVVFLQSVLSIGVAICVLILIVLPKIKRVRSGDKVVMSSMLGSRSPSMTTGSSTQQASEGTRDVNIQDRVSEVNGNDDTHGRYIRLKKDEPLPSSVETKIIGAKSMLGEVADKFLEGRALSADDISLMKKEIASLNDELDFLVVVDEADEADDTSVLA